MFRFKSIVVALLYIIRKHHLSSSKRFNLKRLFINFSLQSSRLFAFLQQVGVSSYKKIYTYFKLFERCFMCNNTYDASDLIRLCLTEKRDFAIFSRRCHNLLLSTRFLLRNLVPFELKFAVFHLFLVDLDVFLEVIASRKGF